MCPGSQIRLGAAELNPPGLGHIEQALSGLHVAFLRPIDGRAVLAVRQVGCRGYATGTHTVGSRAKAVGYLLRGLVRLAKDQQISYQRRRQEW